jgi:serine/threonine-protein kinase HipA
MPLTKTDILVYAHWVGMKAPKLIGVLGVQQAKDKKAFGFEYSNEWLQSAEQILIDPNIGWYKGDFKGVENTTHIKALTWYV